MTQGFLAFIFAFMPILGFAHGDEDHGAKTTPLALSQAAARAEAHTELFELLVTPQNGQLIIYLDDYASNQPVAHAKIEIESGTWKAVASEVEHGTYQVAAPQFASPGNYPLVLTVTAGNNADLIETTLTVQAIAPITAGDHASMWWWFTGALLAVVIAAAVLLKLRPSQRQGK